jgi:lipid-binding SYLF domain-containing protein
MKIFLALLLSVGFLFAKEDKNVKRLNEAAEVFGEIMATPDKAIPQDLIEKARCIVIVPGLKKGAFGIGGEFGRGYAACRKESGAGWSAPGAVRVEGGSFGFQIGGSSSDLVLLVMNQRGMNRLFSSKFTLGGDASVAAGPVGRTAQASTDVTLAAEILSWSRARGVFAGVSLQGATLRQDIDVNESLFGKRLENKEILTTDVNAPASAAKLVSALNKYALHGNKSD